MKQRLLKIFTVLMIITTLTMANFIMLCADVVSYAIDAASSDVSTSHKNIEYMAYFKDSEGNKNTDITAYADSSDLKLCLEVTVKQEGYFNGTITVDSANFSIKNNIENEAINKIENNVITLNQINSGETKTIELDIEVLKNEQFDLGLINMESKISLSGIYRDSTEKDITVTGTRTLNLTFAVNSETAKSNNVLNQEVITNKVLSYNGEEKRIVQVSIDSGINNNLYPIKESIINIQAPKISNSYPETVLVNSNEVLATNGKLLSTSDYTYNSETGLITVDLKNDATENVVNWVKNSKDNIIVTYIFGKDTEVTNAELSVNSKIEFYDMNSTTVTAENQITITSEEKDETVSISGKYVGSEIYKGNLYFGIDKDVTEQNVIDINLNDITGEINIIPGNQALYAENLISEINSTYKTTKINAESLKNVLGTTGTLVITNNQTGEIISRITSSTEATDGYYVINYSGDVTNIKITVKNPKNIGKITLESVRTIKAVNTENAKQATTIKTTTTGTYLSGTSEAVTTNENQIIASESTLNLKETETSATLSLSKTDFSTMTSNNNVEFRITLNSNNESNELYKNPTVKLELPTKFETIEINSINLIDEDELSIVSNTLNGNVLELVLSGEQTAYKGQAVAGATIIVNANLSTNKKATSSTEEVKLTVTNQKAINMKNEGIETAQINIVSYAGIVTVSKVVDYGIEVINNEGTKTGTLPVASEAKNISFENTIINNKGNEISDVKILGLLPVNEASNNNNIETTIAQAVNVTGVDASNVKVYYSSNVSATEDISDSSNGWTEDITNAKKYLVVINKLNDEEVNISYQITIPEGLEYNKTLEADYDIYYTDSSTLVSEKTELDSYSLTTGKGAVLDTSLKATVGGETVQSVKQGEVVRYAITVTNTGTDDISNVKATGLVPDGTTYMEVKNLELALNSDVNTDNYDPYEKNEELKTVTFTFDNIKQGETKTAYYTVQVNEDTDVSNITNKITTSYAEFSKESNQLTLNVDKAKLRVALYGINVGDDIQSGYGYEYVASIKNLTSEKLNNVRLDITNSDDIDITTLAYNDSNDELQYVEEQNYIVIDEIPANGYVDVSVDTRIKAFSDSEQKTLNLVAKATYNNTQYKSNILGLNTESVNLSIDVSSENGGEYVNAGDTIQYKIKLTNNGTNTVNNITIENEISDYTSLETVKKNNQEINATENNGVITIADTLDAGSSVEYVITVVVDLIPGNTTAIEISNNTIVSVEDVIFKNETIKHIIQPSSDLSEEDSTTNGSGTDALNEDDDSSTTNKIISGFAWLDEDSNGQKDSGEELLSGIKVLLLNTNTNKIVTDSEGEEKTSTTNEEGFYSISGIPQGEYLVIFEYDTSKYMLTNYKKEGVAEQYNSNVITRTINLNNEEKTVASTEIIKIEDSNIGNINIGLQEAKAYDLKLDKYVSKIIVQNSQGTQENSYDNVSLAKAEIKAKLVNSTNVVVEYTIIITNEGEVDAYVKKIVDYISTDYKFSSELNSNWYQSGNDLYNASLANEAIKPGQSKEIKLIVTKQMNESNTGLVTNNAEIAESYNDYGLTDIDSIAGNKTQGEDDMGTADVILSIKTGEIITTILLIISTVLILSAGTFIITRIVLRRKLI